jgi:hypothetical protein
MEQMMLEVIHWKRKVGFRRAPRRRRGQDMRYRIKSLKNIWLLPHLCVTALHCSVIKDKNINNN